MLLASGVGEFCTKAKDLIRFIGWALTFFKIAIPLVIVIYGMIDFGKAVVAEKDDDIKKSAKTLGRRAIAGIVIFFIPTIVIWLFGQVSDYSSDKNAANFSVCENCLLHPGSCK